MGVRATEKRRRLGEVALVDAWMRGCVDGCVGAWVLVDVLALPIMLANKVT